MSWPLVFTTSARNEIKKLDPSVLARIQEDLGRLAADPLRGKALGGRLMGMRSWRSGDCRVLYAVQASEGRLMIYRVAHRREVYR